jgi:hypothetical protein
MKKRYGQPDTDNTGDNETCRGTVGGREGEWPKERSARLYPSPDDERTNERRTTAVGFSVIGHFHRPTARLVSYCNDSVTDMNNDGRLVLLTTTLVLLKVIIIVLPTTDPVVVVVMMIR